MRQSGDSLELSVYLMDEQNLQDSYVGLCTEPPTSISASLLGFSYVETRRKALHLRTRRYDDESSVLRGRNSHPVIQGL